MNIEHKGSKILIVEDNTANIDILLDLLQDYDVRAVLSGEEALKAIQEELPELILLDIGLPGIDGFEVCRRIKSQTRTKEIPVVFLSASNDNASILQGFETGGVDFVTKPYRTKEVLARVKTHLQLFHALRKLEKIATSDDLTGISNRRKFHMRATRFVELGIAKDAQLFLCLIQLDNFKQINDDYGHQIGDKVIQTFTAAVKEILTPNSCFARMDSIVFAIMLNASRDKAFKQMELIRTMAQKIRPVQNKPTRISLSIGISKLTGTGDNIDRMLKRADIALYEAKTTGGNTIRANIEAPPL